MKDKEQEPSKVDFDWPTQRADVDPEDPDGLTPADFVVLSAAKGVFGDAFCSMAALLRNAARPGYEAGWDAAIQGHVPLGASGQDFKMGFQAAELAAEIVRAVFDAAEEQRGEMGDYHVANEFEAAARIHLASGRLFSAVGRGDEFDELRSHVVELMGNCVLALLDVFPPEPTSALDKKPGPSPVPAGGAATP